MPELIGAGPRRRTERPLPRALAVLVAGCVPLLAGCGAQDAAAVAKERLADGMREAHQRALAARAADPTARGQAAADRLGYAVTGGNSASLVSAAAIPAGVEVVTLLGARAQTGGGLSYDQTTVGACVRTRATPGSETADAGGRGTVVTEPVPCPAGAVPTVEGRPVDAVAAGLRTLRSDVPRPEPGGCLGDSGDCPGG